MDSRGCGQRLSTCVSFATGILQASSKASSPAGAQLAGKMRAHVVGSGCAPLNDSTWPILTYIISVGKQQMHLY